MVKDKHRVNFHVTLNIYLQSGRELSGPDFVRLWSGMAVFGNEVCSGGFWHKGAVPEGDQRPVRVGAVEPLQSLLEKGGNLPIFGGGTYSKAHLVRKSSTLDCDFYYAHSDESRWMGVATLPNIHFAVSDHWYERVGTEVVLEKMKEHVAIADRYEPPYGLIDIAIPENCYAGLNYGSIFFGNNYLHSWIEQANWVYAASKRRDKARGIYWGNYFGAQILERLGGREPFLARFRAQATLPDGSLSAHIWEFPNGVFVSLSLDPLDCKPGPPMGATHLLWFVCELGKCGVLDAWSRWNGVPNQPEGPPESAHLSVALSQATAAQSNGSLPNLRDLTALEKERINECIAAARSLAEKYCNLPLGVQLNSQLLDKVHARWLHDWHEELTEPDPNPVLNAIGLAFGQFLVDSLNLQWVVASESTSTGTGVRYDGGSPILVFPTQVVAKRLAEGTTGVLEPLYNAIIRPASLRQRP